MLFKDLEIFLLGAATLLDTALLLILLDRSNRRRIVAPLLLLVLGAWLFHAGAWGQVLLRDSLGSWTAWLYWLVLLLTAAGLLLMPSAMLHGVLRAYLTGIDPHTRPDWRYILLYTPLLALFPLSFTLQSDTQLAFTVQLSAWILPYLIWLTTVNSVSGLVFLRIYPRFALPWNRLFAQVTGWALLALALSHSLLFFIITPFWPEQRQLWQLLAALTPIPLVLLVSYFIVRFNFMQLVLERVVIYGALVVTAILFHTVFLQDVWNTLSDRFRIDFVIVEGIILGSLILLIRPLRQRSAEALRYLLGQSIHQFRSQTRQFARQLVEQGDNPPVAILDWFCRTAPQALQLGYCTVYLLDVQDRISLCVGQERHRLTDTEVAALWHDLNARGRLACRAGEAPSVAQSDGLLAVNATAVVLLEHPSVHGLLLLGWGRGDMFEERLNALILLAEQLALTLHSSQLQAQRLQAERRAMQNDKLSALGLVAGSIAHEVKNPLSSLKTIASVMREELANDHAHVEDLELMLSELNRLGQTVNRLLQFAHPPRHDAQSACVQDEVDILLQVLRHLARQKNIELQCEPVDHLPMVALAPHSLREILFNLLGNAIEAASSGAYPNSWVKVSGQFIQDSQGDQVEIQVADNGPGINTAVREQLFQPFVSSKAQGTGLGLYLVGLRVREAGGRISCHSPTADDGNGTLFIMHLPLATTPCST